MRVLTYNIHGWRGADGSVDVARLARVIRSTEADVVALNEVFHPWLPPGQGQPALDLLAAELGMTACFGAALTPNLAFAPLSPYGNALLTRYPVLAHAGHHLTPVAGHEQRGLLEVRVLLPARRAPLSIYVTHLDHKSEAVRVQQLTALQQWTVRDRGRPHLLLGDFNALAPDDLAVQPALREQLPRLGDRSDQGDESPQVVARLVRARYVDAGAAERLPTFPAAEPLIRIDYVFVAEPLAPALRWCRPWQTDETAVASDHLPLLAEFA